MGTKLSYGAITWPLHIRFVSGGTSVASRASMLYWLPQKTPHSETSPSSWIEIAATTAPIENAPSAIGGHWGSIWARYTLHDVVGITRDGDSSGSGPEMCLCNGLPATLRCLWIFASDNICLFFQGDICQDSRRSDGQPIAGEAQWRICPDGRGAGAGINCADAN